MNDKNDRFKPDENYKFKPGEIVYLKGWNNNRFVAHTQPSRRKQVIEILEKFIFSLKCQEKGICKNCIEKYVLDKKEDKE